MSPTSAKGPEGSDERRKLNDETRFNEGGPIRAESKSKCDEAEQQAKSNKKRGRKKIIPVRVTKALKICPRPENRPVVTFPDLPNRTSANHALTNGNVHNFFPRFNGVTGYPPPTMQPQQQPCGGGEHRSEDGQARITEPQQHPYGGAWQQVQNRRASNATPTTTAQKPELNKTRDPHQNAPGAQLQPDGLSKAGARSKTDANESQKSKQTVSAAQIQSHEIPSIEVQRSTHMKTTQKTTENISGSQLQSHGIAQPDGIPEAEIQKNMPKTTIEKPMQNSSASQLLSLGKPSIEAPKEMHARISHVPVRSNPGPQVQSKEIAITELPKNTPKRNSQYHTRNSSHSLSRLQFRELQFDIPPQTCANTAKKPPRKATLAQIQIHEVSKVEIQKNKSKGLPYTSMRDTSVAPEVQSRQACRTPIEIGKSSQENRADPRPARKQYTRACEARMTHISKIGVQPSSRSSVGPQYLRNVQTQRCIPANYSSIDQRSDSRTQTSPIPSWAVGRPLCHYLFNKEIGDPDYRLHFQYQGPSTNPQSYVVSPFLAEVTEEDLEMVPAALPHQPYLTWTWSHENSHPKPLDNLTSFSRAFPSGINLWPCLSLERIREKNFLASCEDKMLLRLMGRYLVENALDQIARCDRSSELEPKWLVTPKNLYEKGTRNLIPKQDKQKGYRCSCKRGKEQNRSGRYGVSCSDGLCENRAMNIECVPGRCGGGECCKNARIQKQQFPRVILQKSLERGYGILAREKIAAGTMVGEYVGEVLNAEMFKERMMNYEGEQDFYFMSLTPKLYIDASRKGGISRFINHSCDPNCVAEKWNAGGEPHIAIVAMRDIIPYEEITFSYHAQLVGTRPVKCLCGSESCQGWLTPGYLSTSRDIHGNVTSSETERVVAKKIELAHSDIALAEEILQKVYGCA